MPNKIIQQVTQFWKGQSTKQKVVLVALVVLVVVMVPLLISWATRPSYAVAFSGLSEEDAAAITQKLDEQGVSYQLRGTSTILVPSNEVYTVRLSMAQAGIPKDNTVGFEIFGQSTLGMTEFSQQVNYQRALEGELERTIGSLDAVQGVRVNLVIPEKTLLAQEQAPTTASVTLQTKSGRSLDNNQVQAITHLVASSVEGLKPANVVVVDTQGNLLASGDTASGAGGSGSQATDQRAAEQAAARQVQQKVQAMLDSVLGPNKSVVQASVSMDWSSKDTTTQTYDPTPSAVRSSQHVQESYTTAGSTTGGIPGLQSNLPTAVPTLANGQTPLEYQHSEDTNNYELSQTQTHEVVTPGTIKQISLAVLVDGVSDTGQLNAIRSAAGAAAGIDTNRGDNLSVQSLKFDRSYYDEQQAAMDSAARTDLYTRIGTGVAAAVLLAGLLWYFSRLVRRMHQASSDTWKPLMVPGGGAPPLLQGAGAQPALASSLEALASAEAALQSAPPSVGSLPKEASAFKETKPAKESRPAKENKPAGPEAQQRDVLAKEMEQMQRGLAHVTEENPATVAEIIQMWMHEQGSGNE